MDGIGIAKIQMDINLMVKKRKKILIKLTSSIGLSMVNNAEYHTLLYFCKWLIKDNDIYLSGIEYSNTSLVKNLRKNGVVIKKPLIKYLFLKKLKVFLHIPVSIVNTFIDCYKYKPDLVICLGGVFYNGLGIVIAGKLLKIKTLVRSAEDHIGISKFHDRKTFLGIYSYLKAFLSRIAIQNTNFFLTVGRYSLSHFLKNYNLKKINSFNIPGPIDYSILSNNFSSKNKIDKGKFLKSFKIKKDFKVILFIGSTIYKGIENVFELSERIKEEKLQVKIIWISNSPTIKRNIKEKGLSNIIILIDPIKRSKLITLLKSVNYLFWSTSLSVGYGQIMLEAIMCTTEILCYLPIGDAKYITKNNYYSSMDQILARLNNKAPRKIIKIPKSMDEKKLEIEHRNMIENILK